MRNKPSEKSFVTLPVILLFSVIGLFLLTSLVGSMTYLSRQTHRILLTEQAEYLADSAIERALLVLSVVPDQTLEDEFRETIAPIYIDQDPLEEQDNQQDTRAISARCHYRAELMNPESLDLDIENVQWVYRIEGSAEVPYRDTVLAVRVMKYCVMNEEGEWRAFPVGMGD